MQNKLHSQLRSHCMYIQQRQKAWHNGNNNKFRYVLTWSHQSQEEHEQLIPAIYVKAKWTTNIKTYHMHYIMAMLYFFSRETFSNNTHWKGLLICFQGYLDYFFFFIKRSHKQIYRSVLMFWLYFLPLLFVHKCLEVLPVSCHNTCTALHGVGDCVRDGVWEPHGMQLGVLGSIQMKGITTLQSLVCLTIAIQVWWVHKATWWGDFKISNLTFMSTLIYYYLHNF